MTTLRVILIGGTSHTGKSTLAASLAERLGWRTLSTDSLARHPGRPWRAPPGVVPAHVAEHYRSLSAEALLDDVLQHYRKLWPSIRELVTRHATDGGEHLIVEGSALWPESVKSLQVQRVAAVWLTASDSLLQRRIADASRLAEATGDERLLIEKFLERTLRYNQRMLEAIACLGLVSINVERQPSLEALSAHCLERLQDQVS